MVEEQKGRISYYGEGCREVFGYIWHLHPSREDYIKVGSCTAQLKGELFSKMMLLSDCM